MKHGSYTIGLIGIQIGSVRFGWLEFKFLLSSSFGSFSLFVLIIEKIQPVLIFMYLFETSVYLRLVHFALVKQRLRDTLQGQRVANFYNI